MSDTKVLEPQKLEPKKVEISVELLDEVIKVKQEKVRLLEIREQNTENNLHTLGIRKEQLNRQKNAEADDRVTENASKLAEELEKISIRMRSLDIREAELNRRFNDLEEREKEIVGINDMHRKLNEERSNFDHYKFNVERDLEQARIIIAESKVQEDKLIALEIDIEGQKITLKKKWNEYYDLVGKVELEEKNLKAEREQFEGLKKHREAGNGDRAELEKTGELAGRN